MEIQLKRQGVSDTLRAFFAPCPHGEKWHVEITDYQGKSWGAELSFPNCHACYGPKRPKPSPTDSQAEHSRYWKDDHAGQIAWRYKGEVPLTIAEAKAKALRTIRRIVNPDEWPDWKFADRVEAYMYYSEADYRIWPHLKDDIFIQAARYEPETDTVRHVPSNVCLIAFEGPTEARFDIDSASRPYRESAERAYKYFLQPVNQRMGERDAKGWLAWLTSEYIKELPFPYDWRLALEACAEVEA